MKKYREFFRELFLKIFAGSLTISIFTTIMAYIPGSVDIYDTPNQIKLLNNSFYVLTGGRGRGSSHDVYFTNDGQRYRSLCSYLYDEPNQLCNHDNDNIPFSGEDVIFLAIGRESIPKGTIIGVLLSGKFESDGGKVILMKTPDDLIQEIISRQRKFYSFLRFSPLPLAILSMISLFIFFRLKEK